MLTRIYRLWRAELTRSWRTRFPYLGLAASAFMAFVARQAVSSFGQPENITAGSFFVVSVNMSSTLIIPIFATVFSAMLVASDRSRGTTRTLLTRPVGRGEYLSAKVLNGIYYLALLMLANVVPAAVIATQYPWQNEMSSGMDLPGPMQQVALLALALVLTLLPLIATVCFGFLVSVLSTNVATAIGVAVGVLLTIQPAKEFINFGTFSLSPWLFSSYYDTAMGIADDKMDGIYEVWGQEKVYLLLGTSLLSILLFLSVSFQYFRRKDLNG